MADQAFHDLAKAVHPDVHLKPGRYWVGVLRHDREVQAIYAEDDFLWLKAHGNITIETIHQQYAAHNYFPDFVLALDGRVPDRIAKLSEVNFYNDNVVVFRALESSSIEAKNALAASTSTPIRPAANNIETKLSAENRTSKKECGDAPGIPADVKPLRPSTAWGPITPNSHARMSITPNTEPANRSRSDVETDNEHHQKSQYLNHLMIEESPDILEAGVDKAFQLIDRLRGRLSGDNQTLDIQGWIKALHTVSSLPTRTRAVIGVVGNTGAGKSSVINAVLDEERLLPTNCMRACTAVVTELSWNRSTQPEFRYRAEVEFISAQDWQKELEVLYKEILDSQGHILSEVNNKDTEAGIAYAKIRAVYPQYLKEELPKVSVDTLMEEPAVRAVLGTTKRINSHSADVFYKSLQSYVDSQEKSGLLAESKKKKASGASSGPSGDPSSDPFSLKKKAREILPMEYWPLIKVVKIYTKAPALCTGAVVVDLPGVHDSNAARAAVADNYMKNCTGLWVVAPITRAVDDKAAKKLMGESFKRQLKLDGTYSAVTFICSKTDDISVTEAAESLGLGDKFAKYFDRCASISLQRDELRSQHNHLKKVRIDLKSQLDEHKTQQEKLEKLKESLENGETAETPKSPAETGKSTIKPEEPLDETEKFPVKTEATPVEPDKSPSETPANSHKRKREGDNPNVENKARSFWDRLTSRESRQSSPEDLSDVEFEVVTSPNKHMKGQDESLEANGQQPTLEEIKTKLRDIKSQKKTTKTEKRKVDLEIKEVIAKIKKCSREDDLLQAQMNTLCIEGRNDYSKSEIRRDFAAGIKELDQETAAEAEEEKFDPDADLRDYDEVARSLPVFCVSSRGYQKLCGRLQRDHKVVGFADVEKTEIPQLQAHCKDSTAAKRRTTSLTFLNQYSQLLNSLSLWAKNDKAGVRLSNGQIESNRRFLEQQLQEFWKEIRQATEKCLEDIETQLSKCIFDDAATAVSKGARDAPTTAQSWGRHHKEGGLHWTTYRAVCRRDGVYTSSAKGRLNFNSQLAKPMIKTITPGWERGFTLEIPETIRQCSKAAVNSLRLFHNTMQDYSQKTGVARSRILVLTQQVETFERSFSQLEQQLDALITQTQREANRLFVPAIAKAMGDGYYAAASRFGTGSVKRMKDDVNSHIVKVHKDMFEDAFQIVRSRLDEMKGHVQNHADQETTQLYDVIYRDYMEAVGGAQLSGECRLSSDERGLRKDVVEIIDRGDKLFGQVLGLEEPEADEETTLRAGEEVPETQQATSGASERDGDPMDIVKEEPTAVEGKTQRQISAEEDGDDSGDDDSGDDDSDDDSSDDEDDSDEDDRDEDDSDEEDESDEEKDSSEEDSSEDEDAMEE